MTTIARLNAALTWDLSDFDRGTAHIGNVFDKLRTMIAGVGQAFADAGRRMQLTVTAPLIAFGVYATKVASDAGELQSAFDYTFGAMSDRMNKWAEETGNAMGRATSEMQSGALAFGQLFKDAAPSADAMAALSERFTELAQDASSFFNVPFDVAMQKIRSGLTGESEPLRDFGVFLNEATVEAKGLELGLISAGQELNEQGKIMARAVLIAEGLADAQGDIGRTGEELANQTRSLRDEISELVKEFGDRLKPYATEAVGWLRGMVQAIKDLPEWVKDAAVKFAVFAAALGPVMVALSGLAALVLPLFISRMGPVLLALSAIINPIGTAVVALLKFTGAWGLIGTAIGRVTPLLLGFSWPLAAAVAAFVLFKDNVISALSEVFETASDTLGPALERIFDKLSDVIGNVAGVFEDLANSALGSALIDTLDMVIELIGELIEWLIKIGGAEVIKAIEAVIDMVGSALDYINSAVTAVRQLIEGDWSGAWKTMADAAESAAIRIIETIARLTPGLRGVIDLMEMAGLIKPKTELPEDVAARRLKKAGITVESLTGGGGSAPPAPLDIPSGGRNYAEAEDPAKPRNRRAGSRGRSGPTAEELAERREELRLQQELDVARERGDLDAQRRLERQLELLGKVEDYQRAGLSQAQARAAAEKDMLELDQARAEARAKALASDERQFEMRLAELRGDFEKLRNLEDQEFLEREIEQLRREGVALAEAEAKAQQDLLRLEEARAAASAQRLEDQRAAHEIELARLRGDDERSIRGMEEAERRRRRTIELQDREGMSEADAIAQATRESMEREQATMVGSFRDAFRNGLRAALDGNLGDFFENWLKDRTFKALSDVLDRLATSLANLMSGQGGGGIGGFLGSLGSAIGGLFGGGGGSAPLDVSGLVNNTLSPMPAFDGGGEFQIRGFPGVDQNFLSLNGNPIARVSQGEIVNVRKGAIGMAEGRRGGDTFVFEGNLMTDEFWQGVRNEASSQASGAVIANRQREIRRAQRKFSGR